VEQNFTDLGLAQLSSPHVTEIHRPTRSSTCGTVLTAPGYTYPKTTKSNNIGIEPHQIQQAIENNPTTDEPYKKSAYTCLRIGRSTVSSRPPNFQNLWFKALSKYTQRCSYKFLQLKSPPMMHVYILLSKFNLESWVLHTKCINRINFCNYLYVH
jgi:hypothetical protein